MPHPRRRAALAAAPVVAVLLALVLVLTGGGDDPAVARQVDAAGRFRCDHPTRGWSEVAAGVNSFVIGNCRSFSQGRQAKGIPDSPGSTFDRVRHSDERHSTEGWEIGEIGGVGACGVVKTNESSPLPGGEGVTTKNCLRDPSQKRRRFIWRTDCRPIPGQKREEDDNCDWDRRSHGDYETKLRRSCTAFANVRPFKRRSKGIDPVGRLTAETQKVYPFWMRYITRDRRYALGFLGEAGNRESEDSKAPASMPKWVFVRRSCVRTPHLQTPGRDREGV